LKIKVITNDKDLIFVIVWKLYLFCSGLKAFHNVVNYENTANIKGIRKLSNVFPLTIWVCHPVSILRLSCDGDEACAL